MPGKAGLVQRSGRIWSPDEPVDQVKRLLLLPEAGNPTRLAGGSGPIEQRDRGFSAGELLAGIAAAQLAGEDFLVGLKGQRADAAGQRVTLVPGLSSTTAAGLATRVTPAQ